MTSVSFSSINVFNSEELGDTPQVSVNILGKRAARSGETLLTFLDLPNASPSTCADITRVLNDGYLRAPGGVTSALRLAIKLASDRVMQLNKGVLPNQRLEGSISCALVNDESVVIAQSGPAMAFVHTPDGAFEHIEPPNSTAQHVIGISHSVEVSFDNLAHKQGAVFVLTGNRSCIGVTDQLINACMSKGDARMVAGYLNANVKNGRMIGVAFNVADVKFERRETQNQNSESISQPKTTISQKSKEKEQLAKASRQNVEDDAPSVVSEVGERVGQAAQTMKRGVGIFGSKLLPRTPALEDAAERNRSIWFTLAATAILLPIIVGTIVGVLYWQFSGEGEKRQAKTAAEQAIQIAQQAQSPNDVRANWNIALERIKEYETKNPEDIATFAQAKQDARARTDSISKITRVQANVIVAYDAKARRKIGASALGIYALNQDAGTADFYTVNNERSAMTGKPVQLQFTEPPKSPLEDIAWATTTNDRWRTEGAVMFTPSAIYEYQSATGKAAPIVIPADADATPTKVAAAELYRNTVYLLDTNAGRVWRFPFRDNTFGKGNSYFGSAFDPLKAGVDVGVDGALYILQNNGQVLKFFNRAPSPFNLSGLVDPFGKVTAMAISGTDPNKGSVFILDSQSGGVLELSKIGEFLRQYRGNADEFVGATDLVYDATANMMFVTTSERLYSFKPQ
jgi:hypothetical protein